MQATRYSSRHFRGNNPRTARNARHPPWNHLDTIAILQGEIWSILHSVIPLPRLWKWLMSFFHLLRTSFLGGLLQIRSLFFKVCDLEGLNLISVWFWGDLHLSNLRSRNEISQLLPKLLLRVVQKSEYQKKKAK